MVREEEIKKICVTREGQSLPGPYELLKFFSTPKIWPNLRH